MNTTSSTDFVEIYCEGSTAEALDELDHGHQVRGAVRGDFTDSSQRSTPSVVEQRSITYCLGHPRRRKKGRKGLGLPRGLLFGTSEDVDFRLPRSRLNNNISHWHFRIVVNSYWSWMLVNYGKHGTEVNGFRLTAFGQQRALRPDRSNKIEVANLKLIITLQCVDDEWIEKDSYPTMRERFNTLPEDGLSVLQLQSRSGPSETDPSSSTAVCEESAPSYQSPENPERYYVLRNELLPASKRSDVRKAIDLVTGRHLVMKTYGREKPAVMVLEEVLGCPHIIPFVASMQIGNELRVVTEYAQGMTLQHRMEIGGISDPSHLISLYGQVAGGLHWVHEQGIVHRDLRPGVIITDIDSREAFMSSLLTGFSEACKFSEESPAKGVITFEAYRAPEMRKNCEYTAQVDVYSLSAIVHQSLASVQRLQSSLSSGDNLIPRVPASPKANQQAPGLEKLIEQGLAKNPAERPTSSEISNRFVDLVGSPRPDWPPFRRFSAERTFKFSCTEGYIESSQLLDALRAFSPRLSASDLKPFAQWPRMKLSSAAKRCHELKLDHLTTTFKQALTKSEENKRNRQRFDFSCTHSSIIFYHGPSLMVNISQIRDMVGAAGLVVLNEMEEPTCVQVQGNPDWEGVYIDPDSFDKCRAQLGDLQFKAPSTAQLLRITNPTLESRFTKFDYSAYAIIVTERLDPNMILFRRSDRTVNIDHLESTGMWTSSDEKMVTAPEASAQCEMRAMPDIAAAIRYLYENPEPIEWQSHQLDLHLDNESVTSLETTSDFRAFDEPNDDPMRFRWKSSAKRRSTSKGVSGKRHQPS